MPPGAGGVAKARFEGMAIRVPVNVEAPQTAFDAWWQAAEASNSTPAATRRLFAGVDVIEVTEQHAAEIKQWAATMPGWHEASDDAKPLLFENVGGADFV